MNDPLPRMRGVGSPYSVSGLGLPDDPEDVDVDDVME